MKTIKLVLLAALATIAVGCTTIQVGTERTVTRVLPSTTPSLPGNPGGSVTPASVSDGAPAVVNVRSNTSITIFGSSDVDEVAPANK